MNLDQLAITKESTESQTVETPTEEVTEETPKVEGEPKEEEVVEEKVEDQKTVPITRFNEVWGQMRRLERLATQLLEERKESGKKQEEVKEEPEPDFDLMTPKDLVNYMRNDIRGIVSSSLKEVVGPIKEEREVDKAVESIRSAEKKYKDFWKFKEPMQELADRHPTLDAESLYLLASGRSPAAKDKILTDLKDRTASKKAGLVEKRSSLSSGQQQKKEFKTVREGTFEAARKLGYDV